MTVVAFVSGVAQSRDRAKLGAEPQRWWHRGCSLEDRWQALPGEVAPEVAYIDILHNGCDINVVAWSGRERSKKNDQAC